MSVEPGEPISAQKSAGLARMGRAGYALHHPEQSCSCFNVLLFPESLSMVLSRPALAWVACLTLLTTLVSGLTLTPAQSALAQSAGAAPTAAAADLDPGRLVVVLKDSTSASGTFSAASAYDERSGVAITQRYTQFMHGFAGQFSQAAINDLVKDPNVAAIYPDYPVYPASQDLPTGTDRVDADLNPTKAGDGHYAVDVDVAIFDTGVYKHSDLNVVGGKDCTPGGSNPYNDVYGHGTAVAGIIGAKDNSFGVVGIAPGARLWALKVAGEDGLA